MATLITLTAASITLAGRFSPFGPLGTSTRIQLLSIFPKAYPVPTAIKASSASPVTIPLSANRATIEIPVVRTQTRMNCQLIPRAERPLEGPIEKSEGPEHHRGFYPCIGRLPLFYPNILCHFNVTAQDIGRKWTCKTLRMLLWHNGLSQKIAAKISLGAELRNDPNAISEQLVQE